MEASAAEGLHLDFSKANPRVTNVSTQLAQPSNQVCQITDSRLVLTPMYMSQQCSNQLGQIPIDVTQLTSNHIAL